VKGIYGIGLEMDGWVGGWAGWMTGWLGGWIEDG
jgi:hypothetical protein